MKKKKQIKKARKQIQKIKKENKQYKEIKKIKILKVLKIIGIGIVISFILLMSLIVLDTIIKNKSKYMITQGKIESTSVMDTYLLREEEVIKTEKGKPVSAVIPNGTRVGKNQTIAYYKDTEYKKNEERLNDIDNKIYEAVKKLPPEYSGDIKHIENKIENVLEESKKTNSYFKLSQKNNEIEELLLEKANIQAKLSEDGSEILRLLEERKNIKLDINNIQSNIKSNKSGIIAYKLDGLEEDMKIPNIKNYEYIKEKVNKVSNATNYGIKIVNNFKAFLYFEANKKDIPSNIEVGRRYIIRLLDHDNDEIVGKVIKIESDENNSKIIMEINNGIENLLDRRKYNFEFVWWEYEGMKIPKASLKKINNVNYVQVMEYGEYISIPVKVLKENRNFAIIENYTQNELEELKLERNGLVKMYDEIVINKK